MYKVFAFILMLIPYIALAEEAGHGGGPDVRGFVWRLITFAVFVFIVVKLLKNPLKKLLINRTDEIKKLIDEATKAREEAEVELTNYKHKLETMEQELEMMKKRAFEAIETEKEQILQDAEKNIEKLKKFAENLIESEVAKAKQELKEKTVELAMKLTEEKLDVSLDKAAKEKLTREYIKKLLEVQN
ncbi:ATP synthase F0 subunit B [Deferribacter autotrophicus]|uniref:ATP synthase subunit b n=1 Tax=Deferribacter autotrophicus TaxID=500465 RepID=A0A5A8F4I4_9BACT|nr:ATP synthase F0 subunit B [Deferribacter autotrophicus]KAA0258501.1 ATP synthase F0 subunit B [Deferribacter autotrophicus]